MERKMSKLWIVVATWLCMTVVFGWARVAPLTASYEEELIVSYPEVNFDAGNYDATEYSNFIKKLRDTLKSNAVSYSIPVLPTSKLPLTSDKRFTLVALTSSKFTTTIALDVVNAYVLGFKVGQKSYFFNDVNAAVLDNRVDLFSGTAKGKLPYGGGYQYLYKAKASREKVPLGISPLNNAISQLVKYSTDTGIDIAPNLLVIIQMISEAARFKYIEDKLVKNFSTNLYPKGDLLSLENSWGDLSSAILSAKNGIFAKKIQLQDEKNKKYFVSTVDEVKPKMALLLAS